MTYKTIFGSFQSNSGDYCIKFAGFELRLLNNLQTQISARFSLEQVLFSIFVLKLGLRRSIDVMTTTFHLSSSPFMANKSFIAAYCETERKNSPNKKVAEIFSLEVVGKFSIPTKWFILLG